MQTAQSRNAIEIKISTVVAVSAILRESNLRLLDESLQKMTGGAADFFDNEFTVIDVAALNLAAETLDWQALTTLLKSYHLNPVAVRNAAPGMHEAILAQGLSLDLMTQPQPRSPALPAAEHPVAPTEAPAHAAALSAPSAPAAPTPAQTNAAPAMIIDSPVRAGQRIYARGADLIVMAPVSNGAELIADGSIHVYAPLRGRALAGATGNTDARIFTLSLEAELVSIAGMYRTFESDLAPELMRRPAQVRLVNERIDIQAIIPAAR